MRLELDIDDELFRCLEVEARQSGLMVEIVVNCCIRRGLQRLKADESRPGYRCPPFPMGWPADVDLDKALSLAAELEDAERAV